MTLTPTISAPPPIEIDGDTLFLDFDGTLVEIADGPDRIVVPGDLSDLLEALARVMDGRLVIVSGRPLDDLDRHIGRRMPYVAGVHGGEMRGVAAPMHDPDVTRALTRARRRIIADSDGLLVEEKGLSIALHYRSTPERRTIAHALAEEVVAESDGKLCVLPGRMVYEIKPIAFDKGRAVRRFLADPAFAGHRPVFVGDDLTDEDGFAIAARSGGYGVLVGEPRRTRARYRVGSVSDVHDWLWAAARP